MNTISRLLLGLTAFFFVLGSNVSVHAQDDGERLPLVTGVNWNAATENEKLAFLLGMGTALEVEREFQAHNPEPPDVSSVPIFLEGLKGMSMTEIMQRIDQWYAANSDRSDRPVVEVLWYEMALPNLPEQ